MPTKSTAKKPVKKTKSPRKPVKAKAKAKAPAKAAAPSSTRGFMWKVLKMKEEQRRQAEENPANPHKPLHLNSTRPAAASTTGHARFAGPRRRAG